MEVIGPAEYHDVVVQTMMEPPLSFICGIRHTRSYSCDGVFHKQTLSKVGNSVKVNLSAERIVSHWQTVKYLCVLHHFPLSDIHVFYKRFEDRSLFMNIQPTKFPPQCFVFLFFITIFSNAHLSLSNNSDLRLHWYL